MAEGMPTLRLRLAGHAVPTAPAVVATRRLGIGDILGPGDLRPVRLPAPRVRAGTVERVEQAIGQQLRRPVATDMPLMAADLGPPLVVGRNTLVTMTLEAPGISLTAQGKALEAGPRGGMVTVMNLGSHTLVEAEVVGPGRVRVPLPALR
jgi:flagella basal body P-ring formation protein FlgA